MKTNKEPCSIVMHNLEFKKGPSYLTGISSTKLVSLVSGNGSPSGFNGPEFNSRERTNSSCWMCWDW